MDARLPAPGERVVVAMSGGVDSSVAAALLHERGCEVIGITLSLWEDPDPAGAEGGCCTPDDILDARRVCRDLGVPHYLLNYREAFREQVIDPFVAAYRAGRTPNPCVRCNDHLKFDRLLERTRELSSQWLATGHYARIEGGEEAPRLRQGHDQGKDQSYFLAGMRPDALARLCMPLGGLTKDAVRAEAERLGVRTRHKPDSQDICFIPDGDTAAFVARQGGAGAPGEIVTEDGRVLGSHAGVHGFTVGQRKGLGIATGEPLYVQRIDAARRRLVVASSDRLGASEVRAARWSWLRRPGPGVRLVLKVRSRGPGTEVAAFEEGEGTVTFRLARPVRAVAPGQAAVLYAGDEVLGGGTVAGAEAGSPEDEHTVPAP